MKTLIAGGCAAVGSFMGQPQRCGEPEESPWHQEGSFYNHDFYPHPSTSDDFLAFFRARGWSIDMDNGVSDPFAVLAELTRS